MEKQTPIVYIRSNKEGIVFRNLVMKILSFFFPYKPSSIEVGTKEKKNKIKEMNFTKRKMEENKKEYSGWF